MAMPAPGVAKHRRPDWAELGSAAVDHGDLEAARRCFAEAVRREPAKADHRYRLALVEEALGDLDAAGAGFAKALRLDPGLTDAARRLSLLAGRCALPEVSPLDAAGLRTALVLDTVDREAIAETALRQLATFGPLGAALAKGRAEGWTAAARALCRDRTAPLLKHELLLTVLRSSAFRGADIERLLTALRRALLLELPPQRLAGDRALTACALALAEQCAINEHVWDVDDEETAALARLSLCEPALIAGDLAAGRTLLLAMLYRPLVGLLGRGVGPQQAAGIRPRALRDTVVRRLSEIADEGKRAASIARIEAGAADATAQAVAGQYARSPYPRWTSVGVVAPARFRRALGQYFNAGELAFLDRPLEVLIAGCGTGQQAVQAALAYGPQARVLAIDLSAPSLAYAARMAERCGAHNITFAEADLQALADSDRRYAGRFDVIECTGVLHHLADPLAGWRQLLRCLARDGRMLVGLYSALARRSLRALRDEPAYPGPGCSDAALRRFRRILLDRSGSEPGADLQQSRDFCTTSNFRDLALHVSERTLTLPEIDRFLRANALSFRGFQLERGVFSRFQACFPGTAWPGSLEHWARFEAANPGTFNGMYNIWCARSDPA